MEKKIDPTPARAASESAEISPDDLKVELTYPPGYNRGGQHAGSPHMGVKITHVPTGISAESRDERSQHANKVVAMRLLRERLATSAPAGR